MGKLISVGVDIGGTFTDFVLSVDSGLRIHKVLSTPHDPAQAMLAGLSALSPQGLSAITRVSHGSTVATNAILERKGVPTALITTQGFRDILAIGRQNRPVLYALQPQLPPPLIPRRWCYEAPERLDHTGTVLTPLDVAALELVEKRDRWLNPEGATEKELKKRTLTNLYNQRPTWLDLAHRKLDEAVLDAYGWPHDLSDEDILARLLALNLERATGVADKPAGG